MKLFDELSHREDNWLKVLVVLSALAALIIAKVVNPTVLVSVLVLYCIFCVGMLYRVATLHDGE